MTFFWIVSVLGAILGGIALFAAIVQSTAPAQAALAAIALGLAVIPYCLARAVEKLNAGPDLIECGACHQRTPATSARCHSCGAAAGTPSVSSGTTR